MYSPKNAKFAPSYARLEEMHKSHKTWLVIQKPHFTLIPCPHGCGPFILLSAMIMVN